jgi:hypothetical protein
MRKFRARTNSFGCNSLKRGEGAVLDVWFLFQNILGCQVTDIPSM